MFVMHMHLNYCCFVTVKVFCKCDITLTQSSCHDAKHSLSIFICEQGIHFPRSLPLNSDPCDLFDRPGIRLLYGSVTDAMEATALTFNIHFIDIYVCSWGPRDDGAEMDGPHSLTERALRLGAQEARLSSLSSH